MTQKEHHEESGRDLFINYIKERRQILLFAGIWVVVFLIVFVLMGVSASYVWYPTLICTVMFLLYAGFDLWRYRQKHRTLVQLRNHIDVTLENLPKPECLTEQDYQVLLKELSVRKNRNLNEMVLSRKETIEYVTLWTHQIKTPLTALQLATTELEESVRPEFQMRLFEIEQYGDMMLQYLRMESDTTDYVFKAYPVRAMVNQAVKYFARIFISKGIAVKIDISDEMLVVTDEKWMVFVLKQLISNALKYTKQGEICISMPTDNTILIEDTGIGIATEDLPRIFERGYTGFNGRMDKKATGLGLFLVKRILCELNHEIRITSRMNEGTKVFVSFGKE